MTKKHLLFLLILFPTICFSQRLVIEPGLVTTKYRFQNLDNQKIKFSDNEIGHYFKIGIKSKDSLSRRKIGILSLQYNNNAEVENTNISWETTYLGAYFSNEFNLLYGVKADLSVDLLFLIQGSQYIGENLFDLRQEEEFNGVWFAPSIVFHKKLLSTDLFDLSLGYGMQLSIKPQGTGDQNLSFLSNIFVVKMNSKSRL